MKLYFHLLTSKILLLLLFISSPKVIYAGVMINEIYPNPKDFEKEWIEIINTDSEPVNLSGWYFEDKAANIKKIESILSISKDEIIIIEGDLNSSGDGDGWFLNNNDERIYLKDASKNIIDEYSYSKTNEGWSFARIPDGKVWYETNSITKGESNGNTIPTPTSVSTPTSTSMPTTTTTPTSTTIPTPQQSNIYDNIYITEVYPNPNDTEKEWVELANGNSFNVDLNNWYLKDNSKTNKIELTDKFITDNSQIFIENNGNDILNNSDKDMVMLMNPNGSMVDFTPEFAKIPRGKSWAKVGDNWCIAEPSQGKLNTSCLNDEDPELTTTTPTPKASVKPTPSKSPKPELENEATDTAMSLRQAPVLGTFTSVTPETSNSAKIIGKEQNSKLLLPLGIAGSGLMLLGGSLTVLNKPELIAGIIKTILHK